MRSASWTKLIGLTSIVAAAGLAGACGDDSSTTTSASATTQTTTNTGGNGTGGDASGGDASGGDATGGDAAGGNGSGGAEPTPQTCQAYCDLQDANCTGDNDQWGGPDQDFCLATCALWPAGTADDTSGNTLGCRIYHTEVAGAVDTLHCSHGGPHGGPADDAHCQDTGDDQCDVFCDIALQACTGDNEQFGGDLNTCITACEGFTGFDTIDADYSAMSTGGDTFACRFYHLTAAASAPDPHCGHIIADSTTCTD